MCSNLVFYFKTETSVPRATIPVRHARHTQVGDVRDYNLRLFLVTESCRKAWSEGGRVTVSVTGGWGGGGSGGETDQRV
jgi:hypothetical protein